jgi:arsenate reductase
MNTDRKDLNPQTVKATERDNTSSKVQLRYHRCLASGDRAAALRYDERQMNSSQSQKLRVLFLCIGNSCRSPMAEAIAIRDSADLFESTSAGLTPLGVVQKLTLQTLKSNGYPTDGLYSKPILDREWASADLIINMSGANKERTFPRSEWHRIEDWDVEDPYGSDPAVYQEIFKDIRTRIESLSVRLRTQRA